MRSSISFRIAPPLRAANSASTILMVKCLDSHLDFVCERSARGKIRDACERCFQNGTNGLTREECLMPRHDHVRERDEALDHIVRDHCVRQILEEDAFHSPNLLGPGVTAADFLEFRRMMHVEADYFAAESGHDPRKDGPDLAGAEYSDGTANEIEAHETVKREIALARAVVGPRNLAIEREEQASGKLGHGVWRIIGDPHDLDAKRLCRRHVDLVEARRPSRNQLRAAGGEVFQNMGIDDIVYEDADGGKLRRQSCRTWFKQGIEIDELVSVISVQLIEQFALVALRAEYCNPHWCTTIANAPPSHRSRPGFARRSASRSYRAQHVPLSPPFMHRSRP